MHLSKIPGHGYAYFAVMAGVFITAFYSFRMLFLAFHGKPRFEVSGAHGGRGDDPHGAAADAHHADHDAGGHDHGSAHQRRPAEGKSLGRHRAADPAGDTLRLRRLDLPWNRCCSETISAVRSSSVPSMRCSGNSRTSWHGVAAFVRHGVLSLPFWLAIGGIVAAWYCYLVNPSLPERLRKLAGPVYTLLENKYGFDRFNEVFFAGGARKLGTFLSSVGDRTIIDGFFVNGSAKVVAMAASLLRFAQSGYVYHYAFTMIIGLFALLTWWMYR